MNLKRLHFGEKSNIFIFYSLNKIYEETKKLLVSKKFNFFENEFYNNN